MEPTEEESVSSDVNQTQKKDQKKFEIALLLVLGVLVGFSVKTEAAKRITMGSSDYLLSQQDASAYDLNVLQKDALARGDSASITGPQATGGSCSQ